MDSVLPTDTIFDLIIIGGGCAGLSLATQLAGQHLNAPATLVLESRSEYANDRTWCFWRDAQLPFDHMVSAQWRKVRVRSPDATTVLDCAASPYQFVPSSTFYAAAEASISRNSHIQLYKRISVVSQPEKTGEVWRVVTDRGEAYARMLVDTRPDASLKLGDTQMWQSFYGMEIECKADVFDPTTADLMDFSNQGNDVVKFVYVLPLSERRALVEITVFSVNPISKDGLEADCSRAVEDYVRGQLFQTLRIEHGILPMGPAKLPAETDGSYIRVGLHAGAARASTGYAFQRIQRWAVLCAAQLAAGGLPVPHRRDAVLLRWMDDLFLRVLASRPEIAAHLFLSVFKNTNPARLIRFLSDNASLMDCLSVVAALPAKPFINELRKVVFAALSTNTQRAFR